MKTLFVLSLILLFPVSAYAEEKSSKKSTVCRVLAAHKPAENVIYQAGVDVHGKAVVPADLNAAPNFMPEVIKVPLEIDLVKRIASLQGKDIQLDAGLGMIEIHQDGTVRYGDQDWTAPVMTLCGQSHKVVHEVVKTEDGQIAPDTIKSPAVEKPAKAPIRIITNRPELIEGGAYRN